MNKDDLNRCDPAKGRHWYDLMPNGKRLEFICKCGLRDRRKRMMV